MGFVELEPTVAEKLREWTEKEQRLVTLEAKAKAANNSRVRGKVMKELEPLRKEFKALTEAKQHWEDALWANQTKKTQQDCASSSLPTPLPPRPPSPPHPHPTPIVSPIPSPPPPNNPPTPS